MTKPEIFIVEFKMRCGAWAYAGPIWDVENNPDEWSFFRRDHAEEHMVEHQKACSGQYRIATYQRVEK